MRNLILSIILVGIFSSCDDGCSTDISCTEVLISVTTEIVDSENNTVALDSTHTTMEDGTIVYTYIRNDNEDSGFYTVITDSEFDDVERSGTDLIFKGWKDGIMLIEEQFEVGRDCCHIEKLDGPELITIDPS
ncbi:MAG: hypothetical protein WBA74_25435 [Cyclobacteriaceae bacterium]